MGLYKKDYLLKKNLLRIGELGEINIGGIE